MIDDSKKIVYNAENQNIDSPFVVFDIETTGLHNDKNNITEIGAVKVVTVRLSISGLRSLIRVSRYPKILWNLRVLRTVWWLTHRKSKKYSVSFSSFVRIAYLLHITRRSI